MAQTAHTKPNHEPAGEPAAVYSFQKNQREEVRASLSTFHGRLYADVRVYVEDENGQARPTRKGLTIHVDLLDELEAAVAALKQAAADHLSETGP